MYYYVLILFINTSNFKNYLGLTYPDEFQTNDTTENTTFAFYLDLLTSVVREGHQLYTSRYDKCDDFN